MGVASVSGVLDTGATTCVLSKDGASRQRLKARRVTPVSYQFGLEGSTMVADEYVKLGTIGGYVVPGAADNLIGTHDLLEAGNYLYADKEGGVIANRENDETIPIYCEGSQLRVWLTDVENYRVDSMALTAQSKKRRSEREANVALAAALKKLKKRDRKSLGFKRSKPKKPGRLEKIRAEYNREYFSRPPRNVNVVPKALKVVQGETGSGETESGGALAEEEAEVTLCEEIPSTKLRQRKRTVKFKEVPPQVTRKRRSPEEREERAHEMSVGRVRLVPPPAHVLLRYIDTLILSTWLRRCQVQIRPGVTLA